MLAESVYSTYGLDLLISDCLVFWQCTPVKRNSLHLTMMPCDLVYADSVPYLVEVFMFLIEYRFLLRTQASIVERLKQESGRLRHQLRDTQAKFMQDKELLAQQLEAIHLDMLEREAAFQEIQRERLMIEDTFNSQVL